VLPVRLSCPQAACLARLALPNLYNITIGIGNVAAGPAVVVLWPCDKSGSSISPRFMARLNIRNADIYKAADCHVKPILRRHPIAFLLDLYGGS
jgi:hypothetical protein